MEACLVPAGEGEAEFTEKRSRFIGRIRRTDTEAEALEMLREIREAHRDATHNVFAYRIRENNLTRYSDDGEPSGTSGLPTLGVFTGAEVTNVCCVVTRYFGGTLLGPGGLVRAYSAATQAALTSAEENGQLVEVTLVTHVTVQIPYSAHDRVRRMVADAGGRVADAVFSEDVQLDCAFRSGDEEAFVSAMDDFANGERLCRVGEPRFAEF